MRTSFRAAAVLTLLTLVLLGFGVGNGLALPEGGTSAAAPTSSTCQSSVTLYAYDTPSWSTDVIGPVCLTTNFTVTNMGSDLHTFTVSSVPDAQDNSSTSLSFFSWPNLYYDQQLNSSGSTGSTLQVTITFAHAGSYEFTCRPHYTLNMHGEIYVLIQPPAAASVPSFEPFWIIVGIVGTLAVLSVVFGMIYGKRAAETEYIGDDAPITGRPDYYNDSRPEPMDAAEPMKKGGGTPPDAGH